MDELDGVILSAIEEIAADKNSELSRAETEALLSRLWQRSFSSVAAVQEKILEQAFVRRGRGLTEAVYSDATERRRLYQYGFSPHVGRRFEEIAPKLRLILEDATQYGTATSQDRFEFFEQMGALLANDRGFGFRGRGTVADSALLADWQGALKWWMGLAGTVRPKPAELRGWQRFVSDNFEFRLGVAAGAVVAQAWSDGAGSALEVPSLEKWRETTGLPWFGFWARELLRWGTLDPFVAFTMAQGLAGTRGEADALKAEFAVWIRGLADKDSEDWIDPQRFLQWVRSRETSLEEDSASPRRIDVKLTGARGTLERYNVLPVQHQESVLWLDPAGFELAQSDQSVLVTASAYRDDFELSQIRGRWSVRRRFHAG
ncbi:hypothetical protein H5407_08805 [Mitsuaria sp. WAJ17]|uniref:hypothetical protein n=1 Tax=Mitsuaria sp. WAJ17 TaxID=2761452 RepID=UPI0016030CFB|nr:hypothetical protein [Mitsuaria sp. WAJ17]MBB2485326.1 hypothetical protein [Mitsuaria sp. WAJ17]